MLFLFSNEMQIKGICVTEIKCRKIFEWQCQWEDKRNRQSQLFQMFLLGVKSFLNDALCMLEFYLVFHIVNYIPKLMKRLPEQNILHFSDPLLVEGINVS